VLNGGPPVEQTTAGPVSGYRALTSTSATKTTTPIERIPQAVVVIPRAVIDDQRPLTQSEALRNVSGVTGMPTNTFLGFAYKVRGFAADRYVDGLPNYYDGGDSVSLVNTERIEVLKGPAGILYQGGIGPVGGIINTVSKLPTPGRFAEAGVMTGSYGLWNSWVDLNQPLDAAGTVLFRFTGEVERSRDYVDVIEHGRYSLNPTLLFDNRDGTRISVQGRFDSRSFQSYPGLPGAGTVDRSAFSIRDTLFPTDPNVPKSRTNYHGVTARLDREVDHVWSMNAAVRVSQLRLTQPGQFFLTSTPAFGTSFPMLDFKFGVDTQELASNANLIAKTTHGPVKNTFLLGADYDGIRDNSSFDGDTSRIFFFDVINPVFKPYTTPGPPLFTFKGTYQNSGVTAQLQSSIWDRLHLLTGLRMAHVRIHSIDDARGTDFTTDSWKPLPRAGAVFDLVPGVSVFAGYSQGYRGVVFFNAGTAPKPEEAEQTEGGLKLALPAGFASTLSFFTITRRNVVSLLPGSPALSRQIGAQRSQGFDVDLTWQPLPGLSMLASYAHIDAIVTEDQTYPSGARIDRVPADSGRFWANYKFQHGWLRDVSIGGGLYAAAKQASGLDNVYYTPAFVTYDGKIGYETPRWSVALIGKNLADSRHFVPFPVGNGMIAPGEPRTVYAVANLKY
jgi:iron complex outermembrane receptor protein